MQSSVLLSTLSVVADIYQQKSGMKYFKAIAVGARLARAFKGWQQLLCLTER